MNQKFVGKNLYSRMAKMERGSIIPQISLKRKKFVEIMDIFASDKKGLGSLRIRAGI